MGVFLFYVKEKYMPSRKKRCSVCGQLHNLEDLRKFKTNNALVCLDCIADSNGTMVECEDCHLVYVAYQHFDNETDEERTDTSDINGRNVCDDCRDTYYIKCESCNKWIKKRDILQVDGYLICQHCSENEFSECDACGRRYLTVSLTEVNHGEQHVCSNCLRSFTRCADCGQYVGQANRRTVVQNTYPYERYICNRCAENYFECSCCHRFTSEIETDEGEQICRDCLHNGTSVIHSYHNGEPFVKRFIEGETENEKLFFGLELEVGGDKQYARRFLKKFEPQTIQLMNDSSVQGFEIITMPMTYKFLMRKFIPQLKEGLKYLIEKGFKGHNAGGLHIHVSEEAITKYQAAQLAEILYGNSNDKQTWQKIAQRKPENLHWCSLNGSKRFYDITDDANEKPCVSNSRHTALNHDGRRTHTYEFRIFNSSLRIDRILKNIECVVALLDYTSKYATYERPTCHTTDFLKWVVARKIFYPNLNRFLEEKQIVEQHNKKDFTQDDTENELEVA